MQSRPRPALILSAALLACGGDTGRTNDIQVQITDSAGVRIVQYLGVPELNPPFALAEKPLYRHGANPGDYMFQGCRAYREPPSGHSTSVWRGSVHPVSCCYGTDTCLETRIEGADAGCRVQPVNVSGSYPNTGSGSKQHITC